MKMQNIIINIKNFDLENIPELDDEDAYMQKAVDQNGNIGILLFIPILTDKKIRHLIHQKILIII